MEPVFETVRMYMNGMPSDDVQKVYGLLHWSSADRRGRDGISRGVAQLGTCASVASFPTRPASGLGAGFRLARIVGQLSPSRSRHSWSGLDGWWLSEMRVEWLSV
jgi:hypothetical protein